MGVPKEKESWECDCDMDNKCGCQVNNYNKANYDWREWIKKSDMIDCFSDVHAGNIEEARMIEVKIKGLLLGEEK